MAAKNSRKSYQAKTAVAEKTAPLSGYAVWQGNERERECRRFRRRTQRKGENRKKYKSFFPQTRITRADTEEWESWNRDENEQVVVVVVVVVN